MNGRSGKIPDALLKIGLCFRALNDPARAREAWQQLVHAYPESEAARQARTLIRARAVSVRRWRCSRRRRRDALSDPQKVDASRRSGILGPIPLGAIVTMNGYSESTRWDAVIAALPARPGARTRADIVAALSEQRGLAGRARARLLLFA